MNRQLIVTHRSPDLDAISSVWLLKRFLTQQYGTAKVLFVDAGKTIDPNLAANLGFQAHQIIHVDTGLGEYDHHQPNRGQQRICAASLVYDLATKIHPELKSDQALSSLVELVTQVDHFEEVNWPEPINERSVLMLPEILEGYQASEPRDDDSQVMFGIRCLDSVYANLKIWQSAASELNKGQIFQILGINCLAIKSNNDAIIKYAQKAGYGLVIKKDPDDGSVRIKARPDNQLDLSALANSITKLDQQGSWYFHPSGKMLLNGSSKQRGQRPTKMQLEEIISIIQELYG